MDKSIFRTETRAVAIDPSARTKFRWYWSFRLESLSFAGWWLGLWRRRPNTVAVPAC